MEELKDLMFNILKEWDNIKVWNWYYTDKDTIEKDKYWKLWLSKYEEPLTKKIIKDYEIEIINN